MHLINFYSDIYSLSGNAMRARVSIIPRADIAAFTKMLSNPTIAFFKCYDKDLWCSHDLI